MRFPVQISSHDQHACRCCLLPNLRQCHWRCLNVFPPRTDGMKISWQLELIMCLNLVTRFTIALLPWPSKNISRRKSLVLATLTLLTLRSICPLLTRIGAALNLWKAVLPGKNQEEKQIFLVKIGLSIKKLYTNFVNDLETHYVQLEPDKTIHDVAYRMQLQIRNKIKL